MKKNLQILHKSYICLLEWLNEELFTHCCYIFIGGFNDIVHVQQIIK